MRFLMSPLVLALATACASSGSSPDPGIAPPTERVVAADTHGAYRTTVPPNAKAHLPVSPSRVFDALKSVYEELGVPPAINDPATGRFGNTDFWKTRKLGTEPISLYLNCGESIMGPAADNYRIYISVISQVHPDWKGETDLETSFTAQARNMEGTTSDRVACGTTGRLEELYPATPDRKIERVERRGLGTGDWGLGYPSLSTRGGLLGAKSLPAESPVPSPQFRGPGCSVPDSTRLPPPSVICLAHSLARDRSDLSNIETGRDACGTPHRSRSSRS